LQEPPKSLGPSTFQIFFAIETPENTDIIVGLIVISGG
jgi:hypothetical protein